MSYRNLLIVDAFNSVVARQLMRLLPVRLDPQTAVATLVEQYLIASGQPVFPIERAGRFLGWVTLEDLRRSDRRSWSHLTLDAVMQRAESLPAIAPEQHASEAITLMNRHQLDHVPIIEADRLLGVLSKEDLVKWTSLREQRAHRAATWDSPASHR